MDFSPYSYCVWLLSRRAYSKHKLTQKLKLKGASAEETAEVLSKLEAHGYIKETEYLHGRIRALLRKGWGTELILRKLREEKLTVPEGTQTLRELVDSQGAEAGIDPLDKVRSLLERKFRGPPKNPKGLSESKQAQAYKMKILRFLATKGYSYEEANPLVQEFLKL